MATNTAAHLLDREGRFVLIVRWLDGWPGTTRTFAADAAGSILPTPRFDVH
jgi:hypothetical protein